MQKKKAVAMIYIVLHEGDNRAYIGKTKNLVGRTHFTDLIKGTSSSGALQDLYNQTDRELLFFPLISDEYDKDDAKYDNSKNREELNLQERFCINHFKDLGFKLLNKQIPKKENIKIDEEKKQEYIYEVDKAFLNRFKLSVSEYVEADAGKREQVFKDYKDLRTKEHKDNSEHFKYDLLFMYKESFDSLIKNGERKTITSLPIEKVIYSKVGEYIGDGIDQIIDYEQNVIEQFGYALWTFSNTALSKEMVREEMQGEELYVLFDYTSSLAYAVGEAVKHDVVNSSDKENAEVMEALNLSTNSNDSVVKLHEDINCTAYGNKSCLAFVIEEFYPLDETIDKDWIKENFDCLVLDKTNPPKGWVSDVGFNAHSKNTYFLKQKRNAKIDNIPNPSENKKGRFSFVGKLKYPYVIRLDCPSE